MLLIGLTGSIATGKSTASHLLSSEPYNLPIIDADVLARKVVQPGTPGYKKIVSYFLPTTPDLLLPAIDEGARPLNRKALGRRVFGNSEERRRDRKVLNGIVHPAVRWETYKALIRYYIRGQWAVVLDVPLLFEAKMDLICGVVMVVAVSDPELQTKRLRERDAHLTEEDARNRVASQEDVREKVRRALMRGQGKGVVLWNDGGKEDLRTAVDKAMEEIKQKNARWWSIMLVAIPPLACIAAVYNILRSWIMARRWDEMKKEKDMQ